MRLIVPAVVIALVGIVPPAFAQGEEGAVPIEKAPYHLPVFSNEYVTVLKIEIPPQRDTGYHTHTRDSVSVNIEPADNVNQDLGSPQVTPSTRAAAPAYASIMDNERVRGWRLVLEPGQSAAAVTPQSPGLRVVVSGGEIVESIPGQPDRAMFLRPGEFYWQDPKVTRAVRNRGTTRVELVEFELK